MKYELAKKLKDAGFPQGDWDNLGNKYWSVYDGGASKNKPEIIDGREANYGFMEDLWRIPTLSELIEACGEFIVLHKLSDEWVAGIGDKYCCGDNYIDTMFEYVAEGSTPEESVANLWLALNSKTDS